MVFQWYRDQPPSRTRACRRRWRTTESRAHPTQCCKRRRSPGRGRCCNGAAEVARQGWHNQVANTPNPRTRQRAVRRVCQDPVIETIKNRAQSAAVRARRGRWHFRCSPAEACANLKSSPLALFLAWGISRNCLREVYAPTRAPRRRDDLLTFSRLSTKRLQQPQVCLPHITPAPANRRQARAPVWPRWARRPGGTGTSGPGRHRSPCGGP
jgi:hypothetical protein